MGGHESPRCLAVTRLEDVVVDRFVDQADLLWVDLQMLVDLGPQTVGVHDDRVREADRALVVETAIGSRPEA